MAAAYGYDESAAGGLSSAYNESATGGLSTVLQAAVPPEPPEPPAPPEPPEEEEEEEDDRTPRSMRYLQGPFPRRRGEFRFAILLRHLRRINLDLDRVSVHSRRRTSVEGGVRLRQFRRAVRAHESGPLSIRHVIRESSLPGTLDLHCMGGDPEGDALIAALAALSRDGPADPPE